MENPTPLNIPVTTPKASALPNAGLTLAVVAGAVGQFIASGLRHFGVWDMDGETQGSLTVITMAAIVYLHQLRSSTK